MRSTNHEKTPRPTPSAKPPAPAAEGTNSRCPTRNEMKSVQFTKRAGFAAPCKRPVSMGNRENPSRASDGRGVN
jgi:hypothetical protein